MSTNEFGYVCDNIGNLETWTNVQVWDLCPSGSLQDTGGTELYYYGLRFLEPGMDTRISWLES